MRAAFASRFSHAHWERFPSRSAHAARTPETGRWKIRRAALTSIASGYPFLVP
jgi:hypothetical protein